MAYKTFWEEKGIKWVFSGSLTNDDLLNCNKELYEDPRFLDIEYQLCDFTAVEGFPVESRAVELVGEMDKQQSKRNPNIKVAIISNETVMRGLTRMYEISSDGSAWETQFFENDEDARAWINA
jgi:hypothetical protein